MRTGCLDDDDLYQCAESQWARRDQPTRPDNVMTELQIALAAALLAGVSRFGEGGFDGSFGGVLVGFGNLPARELKDVGHLSSKVSLDHLTENAARNVRLRRIVSFALIQHGKRYARAVFAFEEIATWPKHLLEVGHALKDQREINSNLVPVTLSALYAPDTVIVVVSEKVHGRNSNSSPLKNAEAVRFCQAFLNERRVNVKLRIGVDKPIESILFFRCKTKDYAVSIQELLITKLSLEMLCARCASPAHDESVPGEDLVNRAFVLLVHDAINWVLKPFLTITKEAFVVGVLLGNLIVVDNNRKSVGFRYGYFSGNGACGSAAKQTDNSRRAFHDAFHTLLRIRMLPRILNFHFHHSPRCL